MIETESRIERKRRQKREAAQRWRDKNREKHRAYSRAYYLTHQAQAREANYWHNAWRSYGLTKSDYMVLWGMQDGCCGICGDVAPNGQRLHIDHCHNTGKVRGLLCGDCNRGLGLFKDNPQHLSRAAVYVDH